MRAAHASWVALLLTSGCLRFGYDVSRKRDASPDASQVDAGSPRAKDAAVADAATYGAAAGSGAAGSSGSGSGAAGQAGSGGMAGSADSGSGGAAGAAGSKPDAGAEVDPVLGNTGLHVSDILGFYSGKWGDMLLRKQGDEIWGAYDFSDGTIIGQITSDGVFEGWWSQFPLRAGLTAGEVEFRWSQMSGTAIFLDGRWRSGTSGDWVDDWDVYLITDREAPSSLSDQFNSPGDFVRHP